MMERIPFLQVIYLSELDLGVGGLERAFLTGSLWRDRQILEEHGNSGDSSKFSARDIEVTRMRIENTMQELGMCAPALL